MEKAVKEVKDALNQVNRALRIIETESICLQVKKESLYSHRADLENILDALQK